MPTLRNGESWKVWQMRNTLCESCLILEPTLRLSITCGFFVAVYSYRPATTSTSPSINIRSISQPPNDNLKERMMGSITRKRSTRTISRRRGTLGITKGMIKKDRIPLPNAADFRPRLLQQHFPFSPLGPPYFHLSLFAQVCNS